MNNFNIKRSIKQMKERNWDCIYFAIDVHDTICEADYQTGIVYRKFYPRAKEVLQKLSDIDEIKLILYTCSHRDDIDKVLTWLKQSRILFDYVNENPECASNQVSNFEHKMYFNVLLDDKAGFEGKTDWKIVEKEIEPLWKEYTQ